jgi:hypothetical protein
MNARIKIGSLLFAVAILSTNCRKSFDTFPQNPNQPTTVTPYLLLRQIENNLMVFPGDDEDKFGQYTLSTYTYYGTNEYWTGSASLDYNTLKNVVAMEKEAAKTVAKPGDPSPYTALAKFFKAYIYINMSLKVGDLPMSEAMKGLSNQQPKYDSQKQVFLQSLQLLDDANSELAQLISAANTSLLGDFYFQEKISNAYDPLTALKKWQKVVNAFKLRVLIHLSKKESDPELNIKAKFGEVFNNPAKYPLMSDLSDNWEYVYNSAYNYYPNNAGNFGFDALRLCVAKTWLNTLSSLKDLRAMKVADPARGLGFPDTDFRSFVGGGNGDDMSVLGGNIVSLKISPIGRKRYYEGYTGENTFVVGYPEMCLNIAEAINRGWITGDAESWYQKGVKAMFSFYGIVDGANTVSFLKGLSPGDYVNYTVQFNYTDYFNQVAVKYAGNNATGLNQILTQRYLSLARNSGLEGYYQWRRTGIPSFDTGPGIGNSGVIPLRYQYPASELATNKDNYQAALSSQFGGKDDINAKMWVIK